MSKDEQRPHRSAGGGAALCPCGTGETYDACCGRFHRGEASAPTAEALMRSRYSAFALRDAEYLQATWHPSTRPGSLALDVARHWRGLDVLATTGGTPFTTEGTVEFDAHYDEGGRAGVQHGRSTFVRQDRKWFYVGEF